jgi:DNA-binding PadR family transcriptional regulator
MVIMPQKPTSGPPLTPAAFYILMALSQTDQHGYAIIKSVLESSNNTIRLGPGTLYGNLKRFLELNWIMELDERPAPDANNERRRYYQLTRTGHRIATLEAERLENLVYQARNAKLLRRAT